MTPNLEQTVYDAVSAIQQKKRDNRRVPDFATMNEILGLMKTEFGGRFYAMLPGIKGSLRALCRKKQIEWHMTVNGILMFGTIGQPDKTV